VILVPAAKVKVPPWAIDELDPLVAAAVNKLPPLVRQVEQVRVSVPPRETAPPPANGPVVFTVTDELAKLALVIPAVPERFALVNPVIVFDPADIVLLVKVSVLPAVIYPELFVHWEILAEEKLAVVKPAIAVFVTPVTLPWASVVKTGILDPDPYVPAVPVFINVNTPPDVKVASPESG
jgi:hypothetical protein